MSKLTIDQILRRDFSEDFVSKMRNRVAMSSFKYGPASESFKKVDPIETGLICIEKYKQTHNTEYLIDAANYMMFGYMFPKPEDRFEATPSEDSAGRVMRDGTYVPQKKHQK